MLPVLSPDELGKLRKDELEVEIARAQDELAKLKPNLPAIRHYRQKHLEVSGPYNNNNNNNNYCYYYIG